jgi:hypothetical protein
LCVDGIALKIEKGNSEDREDTAVDRTVGVAEEEGDVKCSEVHLSGKGVGRQRGEKVLRRHGDVSSSVSVTINSQVHSKRYCYLRPNKTIFLREVNDNTN